MTERQQFVFRAVFIGTRRGGWYRASHNGERVTLASLWRRGALERRARRGEEGSPDAAYEYRVSPALI